jgi:transcription initiation factor IIE alpha subunit
MNTAKIEITITIDVVPAEAAHQFPFRNFYLCPNDNEEWTDDWSCTSNDRCPKCRTEIEPYCSEDLGGELTE